MNYYHLYSRSQYPGYAAEEWERAAFGSSHCATCHYPKPGIQSLDIQLKIAPTHCNLHIVVGVGVGLIAQPLIDKLGADLVSKHLNLGKVLNSEGKVDPFWFTFIGRTTSEIRGGPKSTLRHCDGCGRVLYFPIGKRYLLKGAFESVPLAESNIHQLVVSEDLLLRLSIPRKGDLCADKLPVLEESLDGHPVRLK